MCKICIIFSKKAYAITEDAQHRDLDGPSTTIPLSEMISSVLPPDKKDKLTELNNVSMDETIHFDTTRLNHI